MESNDRMRDPTWIRGRIPSWQRQLGESFHGWMARLKQQWQYFSSELPYKRTRGRRTLSMVELQFMADMLDYLDEILGTDIWVPQGRVERNGPFREQRFVATVPRSKEQFVKEIERVMATPRIRQVKVRFLANEPGDPPEHKTLSKRPGRPPPRVAYDIMLEPAALVPGSDPYHDETHYPDFESYIAGWVVDGEGGGGTKEYKAHSSHLYMMRDYRCSEGDCAFAAIRAKLDRPPTKRNKTIRRELGIPGGNVTLADLERLAIFFNVVIEVYAEGTTVEEEFDDSRSNRFVGRHRHQLVQTWAPAIGAAEVPTVCMRLHEDHYSLIVEFRDIPETAYCPITGDYGASYTKTQLKRRLREQGRVWIEPPRLRENRRNEKHYKKRILVFDFETIWDPDRWDEVRPYSCAWYDFPADADPDSISGELEPQVKFATGLGTCVYDLLNYIDEAPDDVKYILTGFNSARFDNYILAKAAQGRERLTKVFATGNSLRGVWMGRHESLDIAKLCPGATLKLCCANFKTNPVKVDGFDHNHVQQQFLDGKLTEWMADNRESLEHYNKYDVLATASLLLKLGKALKELINVDVLAGEAQTIGGAAWKAYERGAKEEGRVKYPAQTKEMDDFYRAGIVGGRVQNFRKSGFVGRGKYRMVDVASLYPTVMYGQNKHLMPPEIMYGLFPKGDPIETTVYIPWKIGFYEVTVKKQPERNVLPLRTSDGRLDWRHKGEFRTVTTQASIELLRRHGGEVEVHRGVYFPRVDDRTFHTFLEPIFAAKDEEDRLAAAKDPRANASRRNIAKLLMNSLSGKTAQRNFEDKVVLATGSAKLLAEEAKMRGGCAEWVPLCGHTCILIGLKPEDKVYNKRTAKPSYLAALIYEYSRAYMYELLLSKYDVLYMDTDSALMTEEEYNRFRQDYPELDFVSEKRPKKLGDLEEELGLPDDATAVLLGPKEYLVHNHANNKQKARLKGVNMIPDEKGMTRDRLIAGAKPSTTRETYALYGTLPAINPLEMFLGLAGGQKQQILCSQIQRSLSGDGRDAFTLRQRFLVKEIKPRTGYTEDVGVMRSDVYRAE